MIPQVHTSGVLVQSLISTLPHVPTRHYLRMILCTYDSFYNLTVAGTLTTFFFSPPLCAYRSKLLYKCSSYV